MQAWLDKLKRDTYTSREAKLNRNIFLFNLVLCMNAAKLVNPFTQDPNEIDLANPKKYFALSYIIEGDNFLPLQLTLFNPLSILDKNNQRKKDK